MLPLSDGMPARLGGQGSVAFFAHVGGFIFGVVTIRLLTGAGRLQAPSAPSGPEAYSPGPWQENRYRPR